ncbi:MAG: DUF5017 domain-containing protein [Cyclobacteriaceae bacterium]
MKNIGKIIASAVVATSLVACSTLEVQHPDFRVNVSNTSIVAGEEVTFEVDGAPDFITFFSGEAGSQYKYKDRINAEGTPLMSFSTVGRYGAQENTLKVLASVDFNGQADAEGLEAATWTDITSDFFINGLMEPDPSKWDLLRSGEGDLSAFIGKPLYLAFRYDGTGGTTQRTWRIGDDFKIVLNTTEGQVINVADISNPGFQMVNVSGEDGNRGKWRWRSTFWEVQGGPGSAPDNEDWLFTGPINLTSVSPDKGNSQNAYTDKVKKVTHTYSTPGTYTATFVGINTTVEGSKESVKEVIVVVSDN